MRQVLILTLALVPFLVSAFTIPREYISLRDNIEIEISKMKENNTETEFFIERYNSLQAEFNATFLEIKGKMEENLLVGKKVELEYASYTTLKDAIDSAKGLLNDLQEHNDSGIDNLAFLSRLPEWIENAIRAWNQKRAKQFYIQFRWSDYDKI